MWTICTVFCNCLSRSSNATCTCFSAEEGGNLGMVTHIERKSWRNEVSSERQEDSGLRSKSHVTRRTQTESLFRSETNSFGPAQMKRYQDLQPLFCNILQLSERYYRNTITRHKASGVWPAGLDITALKSFNRP